MEFKKEIENILSEMIKSIKIYTIDKQNSIFDVNYDEFSKKIIELFENQKND